MIGSEVDQLRRAADLISQPYLLEVLVAAESGDKPSATVPPGAESTAVDAAVQRLTAFGAVFPSGDDGGQDLPLALTGRGEELLRLLRELDAVDTARDAGRSADSEP